MDVDLQTHVPLVHLEPLGAEGLGSGFPSVLSNQEVPHKVSPGGLASERVGL
jgi:hypothetical protein